MAYVPLHDEQLFELMRGLDKDCDSTIDIQEFASRFEPVFTRLNLKQDVSETKALYRRVYVCACGTTYHTPCGQTRRTSVALHHSDESLFRRGIMSRLSYYAWCFIRWSASSLIRSSDLGSKTVKPVQGVWPTM